MARFFYLLDSDSYLLPESYLHFLETNYNKGTMMLIIKHFLDLYGIDANDFNFIYFNELEN